MQTTTSIQNWEKAPESVSLGQHEVHIWRTSLLRTAGEYRQMRRLLDGDELTRTRSFFSAEQRDRWIVARGTLRFLLGMYLGIHPIRLNFCYSAHGKPGLGNEWRQVDLHFNLSHSADLALYAFVGGRRVGLDIEQMRPAIHYMRLARRKFAPGEYATLRQLPLTEQQGAFFACWTRKEAYLKARGEGIAYGLQAFEVSLRPGEPTALLTNSREPSECQHWSMQDITAGEGYASALVVERKEQAFAAHYYDL